MNVSCSPVHIPTTSPHFCHPCHHKSWLSENSLLSHMRISWKPYMFSGRDCPGSRVVCCCSNHKNTFSALSMLFQGVFLTLQWEKLLVPWTHPPLEIFCFKSGCCPLKAVQHLRSRLDFDFFASCLLGSPASLTCTSALTEPPAFPLPQGKAGLRRSKYLGTNKAEVLASCWWKPVCV